MRLRHLRSNGTYLPVETKACSDGTYIYEVLLDASVPARLEDNLRDFLLSTSHDLRTPLNAVKGYGDMLIDDWSAGPGQPLQDDLRATLRLADQLLALIATPQEAP